MYRARWMLFLVVMVTMSVLSARVSVLAQTDDNALSPIIFITESEILKWTGTDEYIHVADMPAPTYEITGNRSHLVWRDAVVSPNFQYVAYAVTTPEWQDVIGNDGVRQGERTASNIFIVDTATGQTKTVVLQTTAEPRQQIMRWSLDWSTDSQTLLWLEDAEAGNLISFHLADSTFTTLAENIAPYYSLILKITENRIAINNLSVDYNNNYTIYALDGTVISVVGTLNRSENIPYSYLFIQDGVTYLSSDIERVNIIDGERASMSNGRLLDVAANALDTSLRVTSPDYTNDQCFSEVLNASGDFLTRIPVSRPFNFSPDGNALLFFDNQRGRYSILQLQNGVLNRIDLPRLEEFPYVVEWGLRTSIFEVSDEDFSGTFNCGAG